MKLWFVTIDPVHGYDESFVVSAPTEKKAIKKILKTGLTPGESQTAYEIDTDKIWELGENPMHPEEKC